MPIYDVEVGGSVWNPIANVYDVEVGGSVWNPIANVYDVEVGGSVWNPLYTREQSMTLGASVVCNVYNNAAGQSPAYNSNSNTVGVSAGSKLVLDKLVYNTAIYCSIRVRVTTNLISVYDSGYITAGTTGSTTVTLNRTLTATNAGTMTVTVEAAAPITSYTSGPAISAVLDYTLS